MWDCCWFNGKPFVGDVSFFVKFISILSALAGFCLSAVISITSILFLMGCNLAAAAFGSCFIVKSMMSSASFSAFVFTTGF